jgi:hypothetical protein
MTNGNGDHVRAACSTVGEYSGTAIQRAIRTAIQPGGLSAARAGADWASHRNVPRRGSGCPTYWTGFGRGSTPVRGWRRNLLNASRCGARARGHHTPWPTRGFRLIRPGWKWGTGVGVRHSSNAVLSNAVLSGAIRGDLVRAHRGVSRRRARGCRSPMGPAGTGLGVDQPPAQSSEARGFCGGVGSWRHPPHGRRDGRSPVADPPSRNKRRHGQLELGFGVAGVPGHLRPALSQRSRPAIHPPIQRAIHNRTAAPPATAGGSPGRNARASVCEDLCCRGSLRCPHTRS